VSAEAAQKESDAGDDTEKDGDWNPSNTDTDDEDPNPVRDGNSARRGGRKRRNECASSCKRGVMVHLEVHEGKTRMVAKKICTTHEAATAEHHFPAPGVFYEGDTGNDLVDHLKSFVAKVIDEIIPKEENDDGAAGDNVESPCPTTTETTLPHNDPVFCMQHPNYKKNRCRACYKHKTIYYCQNCSNPQSPKLRGDKGPKGGLKYHTSGYMHFCKHGGCYARHNCGSVPRRRTKAQMSSSAQ